MSSITSNDPVEKVTLTGENDDSRAPLRLSWDNVPDGAAFYEVTFFRIPSKNLPKEFFYSLNGESESFSFPCLASPLLFWPALFLRSPQALLWRPRL